MALTPGTRVGAYQITALIGEGGMGQVYRATDTKLKRQVAIKTLPPSLAGDADRLARFQREAEVLASLNHPNIAHIHGMEENGGITVLVMEFVEGEDLAQRIGRGRIPLDEALPIAKQIAEALEAAHEQGIVHRDLKPANIKVRADGTVKVLDFGLAKAMEPAAGSSPNVTQSPTITTPAMTQAGMILGTAAYMSPEQAKGRRVDRRADVWAFGAVLYEMLTGQRAFAGEDVSDTLANVLKMEPDWKRLPADVPARIRLVLRASLQKNAKQRFGDVQDVRLAVEGAFETAVPQAATQAPWLSRMVLAVLAAVAVLTAAVLAIPALRHLRETPPALDAVRFNILPPDNARFGGPESGGTGTATQLAVSPDGRQIAFVATGEGGYQLWVRSMGAVAARALPGTEDGAFPFWSPDSRHVGFFAGGKLKRVPMGGGPSIVLCNAPAGRGGSWSRANVIVFAPGTGQGIHRVSAAGGAPVPVSVIDTAYGESAHRWPHFLPDGRHFLYTGVVGACCPASKPARVKIGALDATDTATLFEVESAAAYASGHLLFNRDGTLMAQPFDPGSRQLTGEGVPLAEGVGREGSRYASFSVSDTGVLVHARGWAQTRQLTWLDREGTTLRILGERAPYGNPRVSPDERTVAVEMVSGAPENRDIWILTDGKQTRLSFDPGADDSPIWSPDGLRIAFQGSRQGVPTLRQKLVSGSVEDEELLKDTGTLSPTDWSADGRFLAANRGQGTGGSTDIWVLPLSGDRKPFPFAQTAAGESNASFAPNGRWIAYESTQNSAQGDVYVRPFPPSSGQFQISKNGGRAPRWRADGKELFFFAPGGTMMAVDIDTARQFEAGVPRALFRRGAVVGVRGPQYDVSKDGKRFLVNLPAEQSAQAPLTIVVNWLATIQQ